MFHGGEMEMQNVVNRGLIISFTRFISTLKFQNKSQVVELKAMAQCME
jgi:hypothetical protein